LTMRRSILTEKISRRGLHLSREYAVDPLETTFVRDVMRTSLVVLPVDIGVRQLGEALRDAHRHRGQRLYPVVESDDALVGVVTASELELAIVESQSSGADRPLATLLRKAPVVAFADEPLRAVAYRMAETGFTRLPVVDRTTGQDLEGMLALSDLLRARARHLEQEQQRERVLRLRRLIPAGARRRMRAGLDRTPPLTRG
jgi:chloride channel protein, CIC family